MSNAPTVLENLPDAVVVIDGDGALHFVNPAGEQLTAAPDLVQLAKDALSSNTRIARVVGRYDAVAAPLPDRDKAVVCLRPRDVRREDELASLQAIAGGIAHEVKNPMGGMRGAVQLLARELDEDEHAREYLDVILREIDRVTTIIDRLKDLAQPPPPPDPVPVDINRIVHEITLLTGADGRARFVMQIDPSLPEVRGDPDALTRAFLNLVVNGIEAGGAVIHIRTAVETGTRVRTKDGLTVPVIRIEIEDDGEGIALAVLSRIFTPYYSTKAEGSGLGLATTQQIVASHGGHITVESEEGKGTLFVITLPAS